MFYVKGVLNVCMYGFVGGGIGIEMGMRMGEGYGAWRVERIWKMGMDVRIGEILIHERMGRG